MAEQDDVLHLIDDTGAVPEDTSVRKWNIAIIDDDPAVHDGTRFALSDYALNGQPLEILSASSAAEGRELLAWHPDGAAVLLDGVFRAERIDVSPGKSRNRGGAAGAREHGRSEL